MLKVKLDGKIEVATFSGKKEMVAVVAGNGKRYALLQSGKKLKAWSGDTNENAIDCVLVNTVATHVASAGFHKAVKVVIVEMKDGKEVVQQVRNGYRAGPTFFADTLDLIIDESSTVAEKLCARAKISNEPTSQISSRLRQRAVSVSYHGTSTYDEVFTMKDGSKILWNDSGFNVYTDN